eukprot:gb/GEZN01001587.1/.p1 GENE.gb/GEZN01001587.1/~~gb/GEZN01001587.1/.p1  ORF type:complete len:823 (+),score=78.18 gb/GEZN01001587.1/:64-2532(+)
MSSSPVGMQLGSPVAAKHSFEKPHITPSSRELRRVEAEEQRAHEDAELGNTRKTKRALSLTDAPEARAMMARATSERAGLVGKPIDASEKQRRNSLVTGMGRPGITTGFVTRWHPTAASPFIQRSVQRRKENQHFQSLTDLTPSSQSLRSLQTVPWSPRTPNLSVEIPKQIGYGSRPASHTSMAATAMDTSGLMSPTPPELATPFAQLSARFNQQDGGRVNRQTSEDIFFGSDSPPASPFNLISPAAPNSNARVFMWNTGASPDLASFSEPKTLLKKNDPRSKSKNGGKQKQNCPPAPDRNSRKGPPLRRKNSLWEDKVLRYFAAPHDQSHTVSSINFVNWKRLGEGGFSEVFQAQDASTGQIYAIKKAKATFRGRKDREQHLKEVEVAGRLLPHRNVLRYYQAWQEDGLFHLATECCDGNLDALVKDGVELNGPMLPEPFLVNVCRQIAKALRHIHRAKVLHLDLKPENVLVKSSEGLLKLGDFGHSSNLNKEAHDGMEGDRTYMAPELLLPDATPTEAADVFSLGILLFELATGRDLPEKGPLWQKLRDGSPRTGDFLAQKSVISLSFQEILMSCMNPKPLLRPTADEILTQLQQFEDQPLFASLGMGIRYMNAGQHGGPLGQSRSAGSLNSVVLSPRSEYDFSASNRGFGLSIQVPPGFGRSCSASNVGSGAPDSPSFSLVTPNHKDSGGFFPVSSPVMMSRLTSQSSMSSIQNNLVGSARAGINGEPRRALGRLNSAGSQFNLIPREFSFSDHGDKDKLPEKPAAANGGVSISSFSINPNALQAGEKEKENNAGGGILGVGNRLGGEVPWCLPMSVDD